MKTRKYSILSIVQLLFISTALFAQSSGKITYTLHKASNPSQDQSSAYESIKTAMDSALGYYNTLTTISKTLNVYYEPSVQTADASFSGTIRFGSNRSYMVVHTAMHEIAHTVGVGTCNEYWNLLIDGVFTGTHATAMLREITGDPDTVLNGDSQHFWPYGLNYASEVKSEKDLIHHCEMVNAMCKDMFGDGEFYRLCHLQSQFDNRCMVAANGDLELGTCDDTTSLVSLVALNENTYRLEFGSQVLDIPNESRSAGVAAGLYSWNGGGHQRAIFEFDGADEGEGPFRIRMQHSGLYLQAEGDRIVQENRDASNERQNWRMVEDRVTVTSDYSTASVKQSDKIKFVNGRIMGHLVESGGGLVRIRITDMRGRVVRRSVERVNGAYSIALSDMAKGIYLVHLHSGVKSVSQRYIVY